MGKINAKRRNQRKNRLNPLKKQDGAIKELPLDLKESALPVLSRLENPEAKERSWAASAISSIIVSSLDGRLQLLKNGLVLKLMNRLTDDSIEVVVEVTGALRNLAIEEEYAVVMDMYRKNILAPLETWQNKVDSFLENIVQEKMKLESYEEKGTFSCLCAISENIASLYLNLGETTFEVLNSLNHKNVLSFLFRLIVPAAKVPLPVVETSLQALFTLTDDNDSGLISLLQSPNNTPEAIIDLLHFYMQSDSPLAKVYSIGCLFNIYQSKVVAKNFGELLSSESLLNILSNESLPILTALLPDEQTYLDLIDRDLQSFKKNRVTQLKDEEAILSSDLLVVPAALEILSSLTSLLQSLAEGHVEEEFGDSFVAEEDDKENLEDLSNVVDEEPINADLSMDVDGASNEKSNSKLIEYMLDSVLPKLSSYFSWVSKFSSDDIPYNLKSYLLEVSERTLECLNNISWSCNGVFTDASDSSKKWNMQANQLVQWLFRTIFADLNDSTWPFSAETFTVTCGLLWATARVSPEVSNFVTPEQITSLISHASTHGSLDAQVRIFGAFATLGRTDNVSVNEIIGQTLFSCISLPEANPQLTVEALNAIYDVYGDKSYPYDAPVFQQKNYLRQLVEFVPKFTQMVKRINRKSDGLLRFRAEEALENLGAFIEYKDSEYASS
ncbi:hypothetical protein SPOG_02972 [Schizosaccharomyces cryophilus OY26]|uniref:SYO1-like TPR repeats domain-containing protein n=1 Tax=Schizosaccharomyces cryophilus (strain OY26 / ATCC MYA-4695 / CBS 11777 / NBRC 106824 / NRRL Y48691) TaxID=653667 RepID=S9W7B5_SCHCR|nr:uncharacterized protein SPOG_02972 [Schizosaccharomyces cryophilus OY26]EPY53795.1 hypothetical protein SPOG_02972 [Schizosaccharomyces cryophilus OY26]